MHYLDIKGVSCHIGSQLTKISPFVDALKRLKTLVERLREEGMDIRYLDLGGGLGITYNEEQPPHPLEYAKAIIAAAKDMQCTFIFEPGRVIVGNAGILVTKVLYTKSNQDKNFVVVDAGMNDLIRPSLYHSYHQIQPVFRQERKLIEADVVGPICESGDYLAKGRSLPEFARGELMAVMSAGAYGFTMSSNYNSRPRAAVLHDVAPALGQAIGRKLLPRGSFCTQFETTTRLETTTRRKNRTQSAGVTLK